MMVKEIVAVKCAHGKGEWDGNRYQTPEVIVEFDENNGPEKVLGCQQLATRDDIRAEAKEASKKDHTYKVKFEGGEDVNAYCKMMTEVERDNTGEVITSQTYHPCLFARGWKDLKRAPDYKDRAKGSHAEGEELISEEKKE